MNSVHYLKYRLGAAVAITQTSTGERKCLREYASGKKRLAEIGVFHGVNTRMFREAMAPDGVIIAIDPFPRFFFGLRGMGWARRIAHNEVNQSRNGKVRWIEDLGKNVPRDPKVQDLLPVDFIFIDGGHSWDGLREDWENWKNHIQPGGIVALHDSANCVAGSEEYTSQVILKDPDFERVAQVETLTVMRRNR